MSGCRPSPRRTELNGATSGEVRLIEVISWQAFEEFSVVNEALTGAIIRVGRLI